MAATLEPHSGRFASGTRGTLVDVDVTSPTARALLVLEMVQNQPGIGAAQLAERLGLSDRAVRRHVAVLREAGIPVESTRGRYGGYRVGRGLRVPPLMFTSTEALALVMAVLEGHDAADPEDPVGSALGQDRPSAAGAAGPAGRRDPPGDRARLGRRRTRRGDDRGPGAGERSDGGGSG